MQAERVVRLEKCPVGKYQGPVANRHVKDMTHPVDNNIEPVHGRNCNVVVRFVSLLN